MIRRNQGRARLAALLVVPALLSIGCEPVLEVRLASPVERIPDPSFVVVEAGHERPRYTTIKLVDGDGALVWHLRTQPFGDRASRAEITYGTAPAGFDTVVAATTLERGLSYTLVVSGEGYGTFRFRIDADGRVESSD